MRNSHPANLLTVRLLLLVLTQSPTILLPHPEILLLLRLLFLLLPPLPHLLLTPFPHLLLISSLFLLLTLVPALLTPLLRLRLSLPQLLTCLSLLLSNTTLKAFLALRTLFHPSFLVPGPLGTPPWTLTQPPKLRSWFLVLRPLQMFPQALAQQMRPQPSRRG